MCDFLSSAWLVDLPLLRVLVGGVRKQPVLVEQPAGFYCLCDCKTVLNLLGAASVSVLHTRSLTNCNSGIFVFSSQIFYFSCFSGCLTDFVGLTVTAFLLLSSHAGFSSPAFMHLVTILFPSVILSLFSDPALGNLICTPMSLYFLKLF